MTIQSKQKHPFLVCSVSKHELFVIADKGGLFCPECNITYPVLNGIPVMLNNPEHLNPSQQFYENTEKKVNKRNLTNYFNRRWEKLHKYTNVGDLRQGNKILEIGAGQGEATKLLIDKTMAEVYSIDYSLHACHIARRNIGGSARIFQADSCQLPFSDNYFDFVLGNAILHHIEDQKKAIEESVRVCKNGGYVVFIEPNRFHPIQIFIAFMHPKVEKGTLLLNPKKISQYFLATGMIQDVKLVPIFTIIFAYKRFPPDMLFPFFKSLEPLFDKKHLCTSYLIIAKVKKD